jgi:hypothetical protein
VSEVSGMNELLPAYAAGSLTGADRDRVRAHLAGCARCRADLAAWQVIAAATSWSTLPSAPDPGRMVRAVLSRSALDDPGSGPPDVAGPGSILPAGRPKLLRYLASLALAEARLVRLAVPVASALVLALGVAVVLAGGGTGGTGDVLALIAPIVAAAGVAGVYRSGRDPVDELVAATPTSDRLLLLVRLTLVFGYDLALAAAASTALAASTAGTTGAASLDALIGSWLGPMALLSSLSLLVAVRFGPDVALGTAVGLWALRVLAGGAFAPDDWPARLIVEVWSTNAAVLTVSAALGTAAVVLAGRFESYRGGTAPQWTAPR